MNVQSLRPLKVKRSKAIVLVLSGALGASLVGCNNRHPADRVTLSSSKTYTNNHYVRGAGYYHAPYGSWHPHPYNTYQLLHKYLHKGG